MPYDKNEDCTCGQRQWDSNGNCVLCERDLDEEVHELLSKVASNINNRGVDAQLALIEGQVELVEVPSTQRNRDELLASETMGAITELENAYSRIAHLHRCLKDSNRMVESYSYPTDVSQDLAQLTMWKIQAPSPGPIEPGHSVESVESELVVPGRGPVLVVKLKRTACFTGPEGLVGRRITHKGDLFLIRGVEMSHNIKSTVGLLVKRIAFRAEYNEPKLDLVKMDYSKLEERVLAMHLEEQRREALYEWVEELEEIVCRRKDLEVCDE